MSQPQKICQLNITGNLLRNSDTEPPEDWKNLEHLYYKYLETCDFSTAEPQQVTPEPDIGPNLNLPPSVEDPTPPPSPSPSQDSNLLTTTDSPQDSDSVPNFFLILLLSDSSLIESDYELSPPLPVSRQSSTGYHRSLPAATNQTFGQPDLNQSPKLLHPGTTQSDEPS